jgi:hypothetical protein
VAWAYSILSTWCRSAQTPPGLGDIATQSSAHAELAHGMGKTESSPSQAWRQQRYHSEKRIPGTNCGAAAASNPTGNSKASAAAARQGQGIEHRANHQPGEGKVRCRGQRLGQLTDITMQTHAHQQVGTDHRWRQHTTAGRRTAIGCFQRESVRVTPKTVDSASTAVVNDANSASACTLISVLRGIARQHNTGSGTG